MLTSALTVGLSGTTTISAWALVTTPPTELDDASHRGGELGLAFALAGFAGVGLQLAVAGAGQGVAVVQGAQGLHGVGGLDLLGLFEGRLGLGQAGALDDEVTLKLHAFAGFVLRGVAGDKALTHQAFEVGLTRQSHGHGGLQLGNGLLHGGTRGLAAGGLGV